MAYNEEFDWLFVPAETLGDSACLLVIISIRMHINWLQNCSIGRYWIWFYAGAFYWMCVPLLIVGYRRSLGVCTYILMEVYKMKIQSTAIEVKPIEVLGGNVYIRKNIVRN